MPFSVLEQKVSKVSPQFMPEQLAFVDFLLYKQEDGEQRMRQSERTPFLDLLASAKLEDGELDISRSG